MFYLLSFNSFSTSSGEKIRLKIVFHIKQYIRIGRLTFFFNKTEGVRSLRAFPSTAPAEVCPCPKLQGRGGYRTKTFHPRRDGNTNFLSSSQHYPKVWFSKIYDVVTLLEIYWNSVQDHTLLVFSKSFSLYLSGVRRKGILQKLERCLPPCVCGFAVRLSRAAVYSKGIVVARPT